MTKVKFTSILLLLLVMGTGGCSSDIRDRVVVSTPESVLGKTEFVNVLADIQLIEAASKNRVWRNDDVEKKLQDAYNEVFRKHDITESQFKASHLWWWNHPVAMKGVLLEVTEKITQLEIEAR